MKQLTILLLMILSCCSLSAQQEKSYIKKGNDLYEQKKYDEAEANYRKAVEKKGQTLEGNFNLGDALFRQKKFSDASEQFNKIAEANNKNKRGITGRTSTRGSKKAYASGNFPRTAVISIQA